VSRKAAAYWIARSSRAMTVGVLDALELWRMRHAETMTTENEAMDGNHPGRNSAGDNFSPRLSHLRPRASSPIAPALMTLHSKSTFVLGHRHLLGI
jgi:hypothetical protein